MSLKKMFTPPKSKSPWEAATSGSTGGWAGFAGPSQTTNPDDAAGWGWVGPALTTAMGAFTGGAGSALLGAAGSMGGGTGYQGSDYGAGNFGSTMMGALGGYGAGSIGAGMRGGLSQLLGGNTGGVSMLNPSMTGPATGMQGFTSGFGQAAGQYMAPLSNALKPFTGMLGKATGMATGAGTGTQQMGALLNPIMSAFGAQGGQMDYNSMPLSPTPPQLGPTISKWLTSETMSAAGAKARSLYGGDFNPEGELTAYMDVMEKDIRKHYTDRRKAFDRMGLGANEQYMNSGERLEVMSKLGNEEEDDVNKMRAEWLLKSKQDHSNKQYTYLMNELKVDEATKRELMYGELADIMWKYNVERDDILDLRKIGRDAGLYQSMFNMTQAGGSAQGSSIISHLLGNTNSGGANSGDINPADGARSSQYGF